MAVTTARPCVKTGSINEVLQRPRHCLLPPRLVSLRLERIGQLRRGREAGFWDWVWEWNLWRGRICAWNCLNGRSFLSLNEGLFEWRGFLRVFGLDCLNGGGFLGEMEVKALLEDRDDFGCDGVLPGGLDAAAVAEGC